MIGDIDTCPDCGSDELYRSRTRSTGERVVRLVLPVHYYRCLGCGWRRPLVNAESWKDWRARIYLGLVPLLLGLLLSAGILYLAFEGGRQIQRPRTPAGHSERKR